MPDSRDQARGSGQEADLPAAPANNSQLPSEPTYPDDASPLIPAEPGFETWLQKRQKLVGLEAEEARLRLLDSAAEIAEAEAEMADHQAAAEPSRQKMSLWERGVKLALIVLSTLAVIGLAIAMFAISPWLLYLGLPPTAVAAWKRSGKQRKPAREHPPEDEGDP